MNAHDDHPISGAPVTQQHSWNARIAVITVVTLVLALCVVVGLALTDKSPSADSPTSATYPAGIANLSRPSGEAPPGANALVGYKLSYVTDFGGTSLPSGWEVFTGDPDGGHDHQYASSHVVVKDGLLSLNTWRDPKYNGDWVTGGLCQCSVQQIYGAYFVRSRVTGPGPTSVELLWPAAPIWPPEVDFNETSGGVSTTSETVHYGGANEISQQQLSINMTNWHTWGVIWSPNKVIFTVDGTVWGKDTVRFEIPNQPMTLDIEQRAVCVYGRGCPTTPQSTQIAWVAEYRAK
jgi:hypothetical protein